MRLSLLTTLLLLTVAAVAQQGVLRVEPAKVAKNVMVDALDRHYQDITPVRVTNTSDRSVRVTRKQTIVGKPKNWNYGTFNRSNQQQPYIVTGNQGDVDAPRTLAPGASATYYVVLEPGTVAGDGRVELRFYDADRPGRSIGKSVITSEIERRSADASAPTSGNLPDHIVNRQAPKSVRLYPNPARERFFVEAPKGTSIGRVEVRNTLGSKLKTYERPPGKAGYEIRTLPDGLYMITIYDDRGNKLKTLRLLHRQFSGA